MSKIDPKNWDEERDVWYHEMIKKVSSKLGNGSYQGNVPNSEQN